MPKYFHYRCTACPWAGWRSRVTRKCPRCKGKISRNGTLSMDLGAAAVKRLKIDAE